MVEQNRAKQRTLFKIERFHDSRTPESFDFLSAQIAVDRHGFQHLISQRRYDLTVAVVGDGDTQSIVTVDELLKGGLKDRSIDGAFYSNYKCAVVSDGCVRAELRSEPNLFLVVRDRYVYRLRFTNSV